jgi:hypothetical protein
MKPLLTLLTLTTTLAAAVAATALTVPLHPGLAITAGQPAEPQLWRVDSDNEPEGGWLGALRARDDDDDDDDDDEGCGDDDDEGGGNCLQGAGNPAPAGSVEPPKNGLFEGGTAPVVKTN